jgi:hypothetical protein
MLKDFEYAACETAETDSPIQPARDQTATARPQLSLIDALGLPPGIEDADLDITPDRTPARAADFD